MRNAEEASHLLQTENEATSSPNQEEIYNITEEEKGFLAPLEFDHDLKLTNDDGERVLNSQHTNRSKATSNTTESDLVRAVEDAYNRGNFQDFEQYKDNLNLPEEWQLLTTGYNSSRGNGYFGTALWNQELRTIWIIHIATRFTFNLLSPKFFSNLSRSLFRLDLSKRKLFLYEPQIKSAMTFTHKVKEMLKGIEGCADVKLCFTGNPTGLWLAKLSHYTSKYLDVKHNANNKDYFTRFDDDTPNVDQQQFHIPEDLCLKLSNPDFAKKINPFEIDQEEFLRQNPFPSPKEMASFAKAAYAEPSTLENQTEPHVPNGWEFLTAACNNSWGNCYFGVAFWNPTLHQIVVAHRGTLPSLYNFKRNWSILYKTDYAGISKVQYVPQVNSAITFAEMIREATEGEPSIRLNFTGHSLGGWLAQITTFSVKYLRPQAKYFQLCSDSTQNCHPHTVVFESPGCRDMLLKIEKDLAPKYYNQVDIDKRLDITVYLSLPNKINSCNIHVGTIYTFVRHLYGWASRLNFFSYLLQTHTIDHIVNAFAAESDYSKLVKAVLDFPSGKDERLKLENYDDSSCFLRLFSEQEVCLLSILETLQTEAKNLKTECCMKQKVTKLPKISLDGANQILKCRNGEDLNEVVKFTKQSARVCLKEVLKLFNLNTSEITHNDMQFLDNFGIREFLSSSDHRFWLLDVDLVVISSVRSILGHPDINSHFNILYLKWSHLEKVLKLIDMFVVFGMASLVVIEYDLSQSSSFLEDIVNHFREGKSKTGKCILLSTTKEVSDIFKQDPQLFKHQRVALESLDLEKDSQQKFLINCLNQNRSDITEMDVFYHSIKEEVSLKNVPLVLKNGSSTNARFFISCTDKQTDVYEQLQPEIKKQFEDAEKQELIKINYDLQQNYNERLAQFKSFCQKNSKEQIIWLEINKTNKVCTCICIYNSNLCIPRELQSKLYINKDSIQEALLHETLKDTCIIIKEPDVKGVAPFLEKLNGVSNVHIVTSMEEAENLSKDSESPSHILTFTRSQQIEWKSSNKSLDKIKPHIKHEASADDGSNYFTAEDSFIEQRRKTVIIGDVPGMGKTTICKKLLAKLEGAPTIHFDLKKCVESVQALPQNLNLETAIQFLIEHISGERSALDTSLLKKALKESLGNKSNSVTLVLLFDGFDELPQRGKDGSELHPKLLELLRYFSHKTTAIVWVTTRKHCLEMLEDGLFVFGTTLQNISESIQKKYLEEHWKTILQLKLLFQQKLEDELLNHISAVYKNATKVLNKSITEFMGIPLLMRMLLLVALPKFVDGYLEITEVFEFNSILSLYKRFIDLKLKIYFEEKSSSDFVRNEQEDAMEATLYRELENLALHNHFKEEADNLLAASDKKFEHLNECHRLGLIHQTHRIANSIEFIHRTYQEYFCVQKICELITDRASPEIVNLLLSKVLLEDDYRIMRLFLDHQLQDNMPATDRERFQKQFSKMWTRERHELFDNNANSGFSILAVENCMYLMHFLITALGGHAVKMLTVLNKTKQTPFSLAIYLKCYGIIDKIKDNLSTDQLSELVEATVFYRGDLSKRISSIRQLAPFAERLSEDRRKYFAPKFLKNVTDKQIDKFLSRSDFAKGEALLAAASHGYYGTTKRLVSRIQNLDYSNCDGQTALHLAAKNGHFKIVELLLGEGANFQILDYSNKSFLHYAVEYSRPLELDNFVEVILACFNIKHIKLKRNEELIRRILNYCQLQSCQNESFSNLLDLLINHGVDINQTDQDKRTLLMYACKNLLIGVAQHLINKGADVNVKDKNDKTALDFVLDNYGVSETELKNFLKILYESDSNHPGSVHYNTELLWSASRLCLKEVVECLISQRVDVNAKDISGKTALWFVTDQCLSSKASPQAIYEVADLLIARGANVGVRVKDKIKILESAYQHSAIDMLTYLISAGANVNIRDAFGVTLVHRSVKSLAITKILIENGADIDAANKLGTTPLMLASENGLPEVVEYLISKGAKVTAKDKKDRTALHFVSSSPGVKEPEAILRVARILIQNGANIDTPDNNGATPLMLASEHGLPEVVEHLILNKANVNPADEEGRTALHFVMYSSNKIEPPAILNIARILTENGANINAVNKKDITPLMLASEYSLPLVVDYLISKGANANAVDGKCRTPLHFLLSSSDEKEPEAILHVARILTDNGANIDSTDKVGATPIMLASEYTLPQVVEHLVSKGANVNDVDKQGRTPLHLVLSSSDKKDPDVILQVAKLLIENGAKIDEASKVGTTPLILAAEYGLTEVVEHLISKKANVTAADKEGKTALHSVMSPFLGKELGRILYIISTLISNGAKIDAANKTGATPLMLAIEYGLPEVVECLISNGANVVATNKKGITALHLAMFSFDKKEPQTVIQVARILIENGANVNAASKQGVTSLMLASECGSYKLVEYLTSRGANVNAKDKRDNTALYFVTSSKRTNQQLEVAKILIENRANVDAANIKRITPLMLASQYGLLEVVECLALNGVDINATDLNGSSALHFVMGHSEPQTILHISRALIASGANIDAANKEGVTPLMLASENELPKVVEYLKLQPR